MNFTTSMPKASRQDHSTENDHNVGDHSPVETVNVTSKGHSKIKKGHRSVDPDKVEPLSAEEVQLLKEKEEIIRGSFFYATEALLFIETYENGRLWKAQGFNSFKSYVDSELSVTPQYRNKLLQGASFNKDADAAGLPKLSRESHVRPLLQGILNQDQRLEFWKEFTEQGGITPDTVGELKARQIEEAIVVYLENNQVDPGKDTPKKVKDPSKGARSEGKKLITKLKNVSKSLPNHDEIQVKLEELLTLITAK